MDKSNREQRLLSRFANKYNSGQYEGRSGWDKLSYELRAAFDQQGLQGAIVNYKITKEDVETITSADADEAYATADKAKKAIVQYGKQFEKQIAAYNRARESLAISRRRATACMQSMTPISSAKAVPRRAGTIPPSGAKSSSNFESAGSRPRGGDPKSRPNFESKSYHDDNRRNHGHEHERRAQDGHEHDEQHQRGVAGHQHQRGAAGGAKSGPDFEPESHHDDDVRNHGPEHERRAPDDHEYEEPHQEGAAGEEEADGPPDLFSGDEQHHPRDSDDRHEGDEGDEPESHEFMADLTRQDEIAAALSADIESVRNEKKILDLIMKQVEVAEKQLKAAQSHHLGADAMAKNAKTLDTLMYSIRNVKDFHRLDRATRRSLYDKANTSIAMTMTMVLGAKYRALLDDIDGEDGMAIHLGAAGSRQ